MKNKKYSRSDPNTVIIIDREYLEFELKKRDSPLLNKNGSIDDDVFDLLHGDIINHTTGFLVGCIDNVTDQYF